MYILAIIKSVMSLTIFIIEITCNYVKIHMKGHTCKVNCVSVLTICLVQLVFRLFPNTSFFIIAKHFNFLSCRENEFNWGMMFYKPILLSNVCMMELPWPNLHIVYS